MAELTDRSKGELAGIVTLAMEDGDPGALLDVFVDAIAEQAGGDLDGLLKLADYLSRPDKLSAPGRAPGLASILQEAHAHRAAFHPRTPREALLAIRKEAREEVLEPFEFQTLVDTLAEDGLQPTDPGTFEWTDLLAERLARVVGLLEQLREGAEMAALSGEIDEALALPPDVESAIDLRRHRAR